MKKFFKQGNKGFTLIELLVVIAILGTLAAVVVLNVTQFIGSGKTEARATEQAQIQLAVGMWMYDNSSYVSFPGDTVAAGGKGTLLGTKYLVTNSNCRYVIPLGGVVASGDNCIK
jgi:type IV pilus assembly protein PilA